MGHIYKRDPKDGVRIDLDLVLLYLAALIAIIVVAIKAIRWAISS